MHRELPIAVNSLLNSLRPALLLSFEQRLFCLDENRPHAAPQLIWHVPVINSNLALFSSISLAMFATSSSYFCPRLIAAMISSEIQRTSKSYRCFHVWRQPFKGLLCKRSLVCCSALSALVIKSDSGQDLHLDNNSRTKHTPWNSGWVQPDVLDVMLPE